MGNFLVSCLSALIRRGLAGSAYSVVVLNLVAVLFQAAAQRAPCFPCEEYRQSHPHSHPYDQVRGKCTYPCQCPSQSPQCPEGIPVVQDGCGCCHICARQKGEMCDRVEHCDSQRHLECVYGGPFASHGTCQAKGPEGCIVGQMHYEENQTYQPDCRTQCTCRNGYPKCISLCPQENNPPPSACLVARLVQINGSCCREWMCHLPTTTEKSRSTTCSPFSTDWSLCSTSCGVGVSSRLSNDNSDCEIRNETRLCELRPCLPMNESTNNDTISSHTQHHHRRNHQCRVTVRNPVPRRLTDGGVCISLDTFQPSYCGHCPTHRCCRPKFSTTKKVKFNCTREDGSLYVEEKLYQWIIKCSCQKEERGC